MVYRRARQRIFVMRSVRAINMKRFLFAVVALCMLLLVFAISMEVGLRSSAEIAERGLMPLNIGFAA